MRAERFETIDVGSGGYHTVVAAVRIDEAGKMEVERLFSLDEPSLQALSFILRNPKLWPKNFVWAYDSCHSCAMGLAAELWWSFQNWVWAKNWLREQVGDTVLREVFLGSAGDANGRPIPAPWVAAVGDWANVTPGMFADQIDKHLAEAPKP
jgi:hypothetical protein